MTNTNKTEISPLFEEHLADREELDRQCYIKGNSIILNCEPTTYPIALDRCDSYEKIVGWVYHLTEKSWIRRDVLRRFVLLACTKHGLDPTPLK